MSTIHPSLLTRKIVHIDMDAFYAAVEIKDNPNLKNKPLVIGDITHTRSVVCTASYEARQFGVHSAMSCHHAKQRCPQAIFVPPRFERYKEISTHIHEIFARFTEKIEPLSLDEAYLDVTDLPEYATQIAKQIQHTIFQELNLSCSAGVAPNKLIAKIASDYKKPAGLTVVPPQKVLAFMQHLKVGKLHGVGKVTEQRLHQLHIYLCEDLWNFSPDTLKAHFSERSSAWLTQYAQGIDERPVCVDRVRKSCGCEDTFEEDISSLSILADKLKQLCEKNMHRLNAKRVNGRTVTLKIKYHDFTSITRSLTLDHSVRDVNELFELALTLLQEKTQAGVIPVRLIGVSVSALMDNT